MSSAIRMDKGHPMGSRIIFYHTTNENQTIPYWRRPQIAAKQTLNHAKEGGGTFRVLQDHHNYY